MSEATIPAALLAQIRAGKAVVVAGLTAPSEAVEALAGELAEHAVEVVVVPGAGDAAVLAWLAALRDACRTAGSATPGPAAPGEDAAAGDRHAEVADAADPPDVIDLEAAEPAARAAGNWPLVIEIVMSRIERAASAADRGRGLRELAEIYERGLDDPRRAFTAIITACHVAPEDDDAVHVAERLAAATGRWTDLVGETAELAVDSQDPELASRWWVRLAGWYAHRLGDPRAAIQRYEAAVAMDGSPVALEALVELYRQAQRVEDQQRALEQLATAPAERGARARAQLLELELERGAAARAAGDLDAAEAAYRSALARAPHHEGALAALVELDGERGAAARAAGDLDAAAAAYRRALARAPRHEAALAALAELAGERGDWRAVIEHRRAQLDALATAAGTEPRRARLYEQLGDVWGEQLGDPGAAIAAYQHAVALVPGARGVLHKLLEAFTRQRQWRRALDTLERLAAHEPSAERRARFHYAAAVIARDELDDSALALDRLAAAVDDAPLTPHAFDALDDLLTARGDWKQLARAYRRQLARVTDTAPAPVLLALWTRLGDLCLDALDDREAAIAAYQVACELAPEEAPRHERLAELYLEAGGDRRRDAITELQWLIGHAPDRAELYKALAPLYLAEDELDKAWCVAQVLVFLGAASDDEHALFVRHRAPGFVPAARRLTDELWHAAIAHPAEDRAVGAVFAATGAVIAPAQPVTAFGLAREAGASDAVREAGSSGTAREARASGSVSAAAGSDARLEAGAPGLANETAASIGGARPSPRVVRLIDHLASVLAIDPPPMLWRADGAGVRVANTLGMGERPRPVPSLLVGALTAGDDRALAFEVGKRLAYLRPERFLALAVTSLPRLEAGFAAVLRANRAEAPEDDALVTALRAQVPAAVLEQLAELAAPAVASAGDGSDDRVADRAGVVAAWRAATDLTANRAGFVLANDLETAARVIATEGTTLSGSPAQDRLRDLLGYAASERYFAVRRHLGQQVPMAGADARADARDPAAPAPGADLDGEREGERGGQIDEP